MSKLERADSLGVPEAFARSIHTLLGAASEEWLAQLPRVIAACCEAWQVRLDAPYPELSVNYVAHGMRADGMPVVLKVCIPGTESRTEREALSLFDGHGAVRLLAVDESRNAILLERAVPGRELRTVLDDEQATHIAVTVMQRLWQPPPAQHSFPAVDDWLRNMSEKAPRLMPPGHPFPQAWLQRALALHRELTAMPQPHVVLHGDLHHMNILSSEDRMSAKREPWLAIDPFGVIGEAVCETGPLLINQLPDPPTHDAVRTVLHRRVRQLADELHVDMVRLAAWGVVRAVVSGYWTVESHGDDWQDVLTVAAVLDELLDG
jgi:streptomycin 6-kinase